MDAKRCTLMVLAVLLPLAVGGCKGDHPVVSHSSTEGIDRSAETACATFSAGYRRADTTAERLRLADEVGRYAGRSDNGAISGGAGLVGRSANRGDNSWQAASGQLLRACRAAGWKPV
ncbi:hypothetical protein [Actinoplanes sp. NPDC026619]|uniref:hypothetical protein n=1 Tax=Actinoplanes sp. NPDC026619 TaxID=3155798 RepID=UPI0033F96AEB